MIKFPCLLSGIQRIVCGVSEQTTCQVRKDFFDEKVENFQRNFIIIFFFQDVVFALAHGRFRNIGRTS